MFDAKTPVAADLPTAGWKLIADWLADADIDAATLSGPDWAMQLLRETGYRPEPIDSFDASGAFAPEAGSLKPLVTASARIAGVFLDRHPMHARPPVEAGAQVAKGAVLGFIRIGVLVVPVISPVDGWLVSRMKSPGDLVGFDTPLFQIHAEEA